jgi:anthranilate/para-aminobenzoate synthase component II
MLLITDNYDSFTYRIQAGPESGDRSRRYFAEQFGANV